LASIPEKILLFPSPARETGDVVSHLFPFRSFIPPIVPYFTPSRSRDLFFLSPFSYRQIGRPLSSAFSSLPAAGPNDLMIGSPSNIVPYVKDKYRHFPFFFSILFSVKIFPLRPMALPLLRAFNMRWPPLFQTFCLRAKKTAFARQTDPFFFFFFPTLLGQGGLYFFFPPSMAGNQSPPLSSWRENSFFFPFSSPQAAAEKEGVRHPFKPILLPPEVKRVTAKSPFSLLDQLQDGPQTFAPRSLTPFSPHPGNGQSNFGLFSPTYRLLPSSEM